MYHNATERCPLEAAATFSASKGPTVSFVPVFPRFMYFVSERELNKYLNNIIEFVVNFAVVDQSWLTSLLVLDRKLWTS